MGRDLYEHIAKDERAFSQYAQAQTCTLPGKRHILDSILSAATCDNDWATVLLLGAGVGDYYAMLRRRRPHSTIKVLEKFHSMQSFARQNVGIPASDFIHTDASATWRLAQKFDAILAILIIHLLDSRRRFWHNVTRHLSKGGVCGVVTMTPRQERTHPMVCFLGAPASGHFPSPQILISEAESVGLLCCSVTPVAFTLRLPVQDIPVAFSRFSNTYLFNQPPKEVEAFQDRLESRATRGVVEIPLHWTYFRFAEKGDRK